MSIKESAIKEYFLNLNLKNESWSVKKIKGDLKRILGEEPGIDVIYKKDVLINEGTNKAEEFLDIDRIDVVFYDLNEKFKKISLKP